MCRCLLRAGAGNTWSVSQDLASAKATRSTTRCTQVSARGGSRVGWGSLCFQVSHSTSNTWPHSLIPNYGKEGACWGPKPSPCPEATGRQVWGLTQPPSGRLRSPATLQPAPDTATWPTKAVSEPATSDSSHLLPQIYFSKSGWASESLGSF